jgi:hypothetical protein
VVVAVGEVNPVGVDVHLLLFTRTRIASRVKNGVGSRRAIVMDDLCNIAG